MGFASAAGLGPLAAGLGDCWDGAEGTGADGGWAAPVRAKGIGDGLGGGAGAAGGGTGATGGGTEAVLPGERFIRGTAGPADGGTRGDGLSVFILPFD